MDKTAGQDDAGAGLTPAESNPDLDRILAELAGYTASNNSPYEAATAVAPPVSFSHSHPQHQPRSHDSLPAALPSHRQQSVAATPPSRKATTPLQPNTPQIDPSTIFEWPQALRCVNKISATNAQFGPKIREMMADQDRNVKQWWEDRNNIINSQKTRNAGLRSLNEVLKGIGGKLEAESTPEEDQAELDKFDRKVYNASQHMSKAHGIDLKRLGVPFFGVDPKFIIANEFQQTVAARNALSQATITEAELLDLQRRMIQYLEDMYKD